MATHENEGMVPRQDDDDLALVASFLETREARVFRRIYRRHTPHLYLFALRLLGGRAEDAEDLVQDTWIRAVERLHSFRWESKLRTWLSGILIHRCRELRRADQRRSPWFVPESDYLEARIDASQDGLDLEEGIRRLPDGYREVLVLHDLEGYTHEEVGKMLGIENGTSKSQLSRARRALRTFLTASGKGASG